MCFLPLCSQTLALWKPVLSEKRFHDYRANPDTWRRMHKMVWMSRPVLTLVKNLPKLTFSWTFPLFVSNISRHLDVQGVNVGAASRWQTPLKVTVYGVRAFIRWDESRRVDVAVSLAPCSPSSISALLWHISLPNRSFGFAWADGKKPQQRRNIKQAAA